MRYMMGWVWNCKTYTDCLLVTFDRIAVVILCVIYFHGCELCCHILMLCTSSNYFILDIIIKYCYNMKASRRGGGLMCLVQWGEVY